MELDICDGTYPIDQIVLRYFDDLLFGAVSVPHVDGRLLRELPQDEEQQLVVVALERQVASEAALHRLHHRVLLSVDERLEHHPEKKWRKVVKHCCDLATEFHISIKFE